VVPLAQTQASFFGVYYAGNQFTPANETDLQAPWLYNWLGQPAKAQRVLHAASQVYSTAPTGLPGNDDAGTMSAWYVLTAIGLYQAQPGVDAWELSSPLFDRVTLAAARLHITAPGAGPAAEYIGAATRNGRPLERSWLTDEQLRGEISLTLQASSSSTWATTPDAAPPSISDRHP
jgi:putative alpha-1,2-mannosidase